METENTNPANDAPEIDQKALNAVLARLDKLEAKGQRLGAPAVVQGNDADKKAFVTFLQSGQIDQKALTVASDAPAYVLAPEETSGEFIRNLVEFSPIRTIADVRSTASHTILLPKRNTITNAVWVGARASAPAITINSPITVNGSAGTPEQNADLAKQVARETEAGMRALIQTELIRQMRPGGMLRG